MTNPYVVLGVTSQSSDEEITKAYRTLARKYHPDMHPGDKVAEAKMKEINAAYEQIKDIRAGKSPDYQAQEQTHQQYRAYTYRNPFQDDQKSYQYSYSYRPSGIFFGGSIFRMLIRLVAGFILIRLLIGMAGCVLNSLLTPFQNSSSRQQQTANNCEEENRDFFVV